MERAPADADVFHRILDEAIVAFERSGTRYALMGGVAAAAMGGHRYTYDIDVFVRREDASGALDVLAANGFTTEKTDPLWLYKAFKEGVTVDVIFKSAGSVYFDEAMYERARVVAFRGQRVRVLSAEDQLILKALVFNEHSLSLDAHAIRHLNDILGILRSCDLDWEYVVKRARLGPRRVLGLLFFAQSLDLIVPNRVLKELLFQLEIG